MEDKKTLWIILGISVCVLIVVAVGFFWFLPSEQSLAAAGEADGRVSSGRTDFDPVEWVRQDESYPGIDEAEENTEDFVVVADELVYGLPETVEEGSSEDDAENNVEKPDAETIILDIPRETAVKENTTRIAAAPVQKPAVQRQPVPEVKKTTRITEYWIQAGSFASLSKADEVKTVLSEKGVVSTISTTNVNGTDYFRVRLGPYSDQMEADKFLSWIQAVKGFENSYISEVYVTKES